MRSLKENVVSESTECLRREGRARANQGMVWDRISERAQELDVKSLTDAQREIFEQKQETVEEYKKNFNTVQRQVGLIVLFNEKVVGLEVFPDSETLQEIFDPLLDSYIIDVLVIVPTEVDKPTREKRARSFMDKLLKTEIESFPSVGLGHDIRLTSRDVVEFALIHQERIYHLVCFPKEKHQRKTRFSFYNRRRTVI